MTWSPHKAFFVLRKGRLIKRLNHENL